MNNLCKNCTYFLLIKNDLNGRYEVPFCGNLFMRSFLDHNNINWLDIKNNVILCPCFDDKDFIDTNDTYFPFEYNIKQLNMDF